MKIINQRNNDDSIAFALLAYQDYLASRLLLINGFLEQGVGLAATAVEKYLKAILAIKGVRCRGHLRDNIFNALKNQRSDLYKDLNIDFIKFLKKGYELRYHDDKESRFGIVINQYRTLAELDKFAFIADSGILITKDGNKEDTPYARDANQKEPKLINDNHVILGISRYEYFKRKNKVCEILWENDATGISVCYETAYVYDTGSFLKTIKLNKHDKDFVITCG